MTHRHAVVVVCVVVAGVLSPTILAQESPTATENTTNETDGMGTQLTAFLQSSSAAANDSVERGMWRAEFEQANASQRPQLVTNRTGTLEQRLDRLEARNETIQRRYDNGSLPQQAYVAQQSQLTARIDALRSAINDTDAAAARAGVNDSRLDTLRENASTLSGPEVAAVARGLGGGPPEQAGPPENRTTGPPSQPGPPENRTTGPPNRAGNRPNETAQSGNGTAQAGSNRTNAGGNNGVTNGGGGSNGGGGPSSGQ